MEERDTWMMAVATALGAFIALPLPVAPSVGALICAFLLRSKFLVWLTCAAVATSCSSAAWRNLDAPLPPHVDADATLVTDPERAFGSSLQVVVDVHGRRLMAIAAQDEAARLRPLLAGDRVHVVGTSGPLSGKAVASQRRKHIAGRLRVQSVQVRATAGGIPSVANHLREVFDRGTSSLGPEQQGLFRGLLFGDDRQQSRTTVEEFRNSGLAHLLAVSGANVAFVLLLVSPVLQRMLIGWRLAFGLVVLILFGTMTRWEPSVVRAEVLAGVVLLARYLGRAITPSRALSLAATAALLADPFLVGSVGFLLSLSACIGMVALGSPLSELARGPQALRRLLGYSTAAQLGVIPVSLVVFGDVPFVGLVTNLLAEPAAGVLLMWGMAAGFVAGVVGEPLSTVLHLPTRVLLWWIAGVAHHGANVETKL